MAARNDSCMNQIRLDPAFDFLRADPRYWRWERFGTAGAGALTELIGGPVAP
jgi:hypothetical protein